MALALLSLAAIGVTLIARPSLAKAQVHLDERVAPFLVAASNWRTENPEGCPTVGLLKAEGFLDANVPRDDPWGSILRVHCQDGKLFIYSDGKDNRPNTTDDLRVEVP
jgi:hypothetical protein